MTSSSSFYNTTNATPAAQPSLYQALIDATTALQNATFPPVGIATSTGTAWGPSYANIPITLGGTGTSTQFTAGSVVFAGASGVYSQNNSGLFWDNTNTRLGIGTTSPTTQLTVNGGITAYSTTSFFPQLVAWNQNAGTSGPYFIVQKSRAASGAGAATLVGDQLGTFLFRGFDTTGTVQNSAFVDAGATAVGASSVDGYMRFLAIGATSYLVLGTNSSERMRIDASGNVGVGTSNPLAAFDIARNTATSTTDAIQRWTWSASTTLWGVRLDQIHTGSAIDYAFRIRNGTTTDITALYMQSSGNVGIGTSTPGAKLEVLNTILVSGSSTLYLRSGNNSISADASNNVIYYATGAKLFYTNAAERMRIDASGNVGIGTSTPAAKLEVAGTFSIRTSYPTFSFIDTVAGASNGGFARFTANGLGTYIYQINTAAGGDFSTTINAFSIDKLGNVGIGATSPSAHLEISGAVANSASALKVLDATTVRIQNTYIGALGTNSRLNFDLGGIGSSTISGYYAVFNGAGDIGTGLIFGTQSTLAGGAVERMRIDNAGLVGIGTPSPGTKLDVYTAASVSTVIRTRNDTTTVYLDANNGYSYLMTSTNHPMLFGTNNIERMRVDAAGKVGIGTAPSYPLHVSSGTFPQLVIQDNGTNATAKFAMIGCGHYTNAQAPAASVFSTSNSTDNITYLGGGASQMNACTALYFYTAANNTTAIGTQRMQIDNAGNVLVVSTGGIGYGTGSGGTVTQATSRTTGVTLNKTNGSITLFSAAGVTTATTFTVTNSTVAATDVIHVSQKSGTNLYNILVTAVAAGSFNITFYTTGGTATDAPVFNFAVFKAVTA